MLPTIQLRQHILLNLTGSLPNAGSKDEGDTSCDASASSPAAPTSIARHIDEPDG